MKSIFWQAFLASIAGGFISLDRTAAFQVMLSRPIVAGPVIGMLCGMPAAGIAIGVILELLWIGDLPVGGHVPPHETAAAVIGAAVAANTKGIFPDKELFGLCILLVIPFAVVCQKADELIRRFNSRYYYSASISIENGDAGGFSFFNLKPLLILFVMNTFLFLFFITAGIFIVGQLNHIVPKEFRLAFEGIFIILPLLGISSAFNTLRTNRWARTLLFAVFAIFTGVLSLIQR